MPLPPAYVSFMLLQARSECATNIIYSTSWFK